MVMYAELSRFKDNVWPSDCLSEQVHCMVGKVLYSIFFMKKKELKIK